MVLNTSQLDILQELINIGIGRAAGGLNRMTRSHVVIRIPELVTLDNARLREIVAAWTQTLADLVTLEFSGAFQGAAALVFSPESGSNLVRLLLGLAPDAEPATDMRSDTLREVGNILLIAVIGSLANVLKQHVEYKPLEHSQGRSPALARNTKGAKIALLAKADLALEDRHVCGEVCILFPERGFASLVEILNRLTRELG